MLEITWIVYVRNGEEQGSLNKKETADHNWKLITESFTIYNEERRLREFKTHGPDRKRNRKLLDNLLEKFVQMGERTNTRKRKKRHEGKSVPKNNKKREVGESRDFTLSKETCPIEKETVRNKGVM